jgi:hypothetical protein
VFLSYAHEDVEFLEGLRKHLKPLRDEQVIADWVDHQIQNQLESADLVIVLVSADFIASDYAIKNELRRAMELHDLGRLLVVPVIVRNCVWQKLPLGRLQALPEHGLPISQWPDRDDAYVSVVLGIERTATELLSSEDDSLVDLWLSSRLLRRRVVMAVQQMLARLGLYEGPIDGIPGPHTETAVVDYQRRAGITRDAMIGPEVIRHLEQDVAGNELRDRNS